MATLKVDQTTSEKGEVECKLVEGENQAAWPDDAKLTVVGQAVPRVDGWAKVTGRARYSGDVHLPGQLAARILRSPHPHARVRRVDIARAVALPGVHAVLCAENTPRVAWYKDSVLFDQTVRFVGDEVAAVAAETDELAEDAIRLIEVDYEPLPFVASLDAARAPDAPRLRPDGNRSGDEEYRRGDVAEGFRQADVVVDQVYRTSTAAHNCLESHGCTASWDGDQLTLWSSTQAIFDARQELASKLGLSENNLRVICDYMGGGFGSKQVPWKQDAIAALLARRTGRPVQLMLDREAENLAVGNRNATWQHVRIGARRDGTLVAIDADIAVETGAYQVGGETSAVDGIFQSLYQCPNVRTRLTGWYTNLGPTVALRAPGFVEGAFALEQAVDDLARQLAMDPLELRRRNYAGADQSEEKPYSNPDGLRACYERASTAFGWATPADRPANQTGPKRRGRGLAASNWLGGAGQPPAYAWIKLNGDGTADVLTGVQDIGTGTRTGSTQIAAEELGLPIEQVRVHVGDTAAGPYGPSSAGSATQPTMGPVLRAAAADAKRQLLDVASQILKEPAEQLSIRNGQIWQPDRTKPVASVAEILGKIQPGMILGRGARGPNPKDKAVRTFGAQCAEVEVDVETGEVTVLRIVASADCGRIVNPTTVESQVIGGVTMGLGFALAEERVVDQRSGIVLNANLEEYKVPTVADIPRIDHAVVDRPDLAANPTGAKGVGEPPLIPTAPAIANAIFDAVGVRVRESPITRAALLAALAEQRRPPPKELAGVARGGRQS